MRADGRITSFTDAIERLRLLSAAGEVLATRLLARVSGIENGIKPVAGLTVQPPPVKPPARTPTAAEAIVEGLFLPPIGEPNSPGATLLRIIGFLKTVGGRQTTWDIADACGIARSSAIYHLQNGPFTREGLHPVRWSYSEPDAVVVALIPAISQGGFHACT